MFSARFVAVVTATGVVVLASAQHLRSGFVDSKDIEGDLIAEIAGDHVGPGARRLESLEASLRHLAVALPRDELGRFGHGSVRYLIHRLFMQRQRWLIRGLEPENVTTVSSGNANAAIPPPSAHVNFTIGSAPVWPTLLQVELEQLRGSESLSLKDVAALAATLEDLIHREDRHRLTMAYDVAGIGTEKALDYNEFWDVMFHYFTIFAGAWKMEELTKQKVLRREDRVYTNRFKRVTPVLNITPSRSPPFNFEYVMAVASEVGQNYHKVNSPECVGLKHAMMQLLYRKPGRVRLSDFYNASRVGYWGFLEKIEYLRALGTLDETNASNPLVIIPNYVTAINQCLKASSIYTVCCPSECDPLMDTIEAELAAPQAEPQRIADLVAEKLSTDTVKAPRTLPESLRSRLWEVAAQNGGLVPLHGRLFAQWMHHAFPLECPFPHAVGTLTPRTPDEWMRHTGHTASRASEEEMMRHIQPDDTCPATALGQGCGPEGDAAADLPWSTLEQEFYGGKGSASVRAPGAAQAGPVEVGEAEVERLLQEVEEMGLALPATSSAGSAFVSVASVLATACLVGLVGIGLRALGLTSQSYIKTVVDDEAEKLAQASFAWAPGGACV